MFQYLISGAAAQVRIWSPKSHLSCGWAFLASWCGEFQPSSPLNLCSAAAPLQQEAFGTWAFFPVKIRVPGVPKCLQWVKCSSAETLTALSSYALCPCLNHNRPHQQRVLHQARLRSQAGRCVRKKFLDQVSHKKQLWEEVGPVVRPHSLLIFIYA